MRVTAIRREGSRLDVYLDGERRLSLPEEVLLKAGLRTGDELKDNDVGSLRTAAAVWEVRNAALSLLSRRARTRRDLRRRLLQRQHPPDLVDACLDQLTRAGLLDDGQYARAFVRERLRSRPKGVTALRAELRGRGIDARVAEEAIQESMETESVTELELARTAARKFRIRPGEEPFATRRRLFGFLSRRGFSGDVVRQILAEQTGTANDDMSDGA